MFSSYDSCESDELKSAEYWQTRELSKIYEILGETKLDSSKNRSAVNAEPIWAFSIKTALCELKEAGVAITQPIFDTIIHQPQFAIQMGTALCRLSGTGMMSAEIFSLLATHAKFADHLSSVFIQLQQASILSGENINKSAQHAEYSLGISSTLAKLNSFGIPITNLNFEELLKNAQYTYDMANAIDALSKMNIATPKNIQQVIQHAQHLSTLTALLHQIHHKGLTANPMQAQNNFQQLLQYPQFHGFIQKQVADHGPAMIQDDFDKIIKEIRKQMNKAFLLGTHPRSGSAINSFFGTHPGNLPASRIPNHPLSEEYLLQNILKCC